KFRDELQQVQAAYFVVCLTMKEDTPENRQVVEAYLKPLADVKEPVSQGLFAGALNHDKLGVVWRFLLKNAKEEEDSPMAEGDWRNWEGIRDWANAFAAQAIRVP
ncbi:MAG: hypothetical protein K8I30_08545, partial [Anaerolineae bacterium]|nr:hypothetical protein [Anaerolineae bacterium]